MTIKQSKTLSCCMILGAIGAGCDSITSVQSETHSSRMALATSAADPQEGSTLSFRGEEIPRGQYKKLMRERIDSTSEGLRFLVLRSSRNDVGRSTSAQHRNFRSLLRRTGFFTDEDLLNAPDGDSDEPIVIGSDDDERQPFAKIQSTEGKYLIDSREPHQLRIPDTMPEAWYRAQTRSFLRDIDVNESEADIHVKTVIASWFSSEEEREVFGAAAANHEPVEKVAYVLRQVNGIRVPSEKLSFVFHLDGRLRRVSGRWRKVDYSSSQFASKFTTPDEALDIVSERLADGGVNPYGHRPIRVTSFYALEPTDVLGLWALAMKAAALVPLDSGDGENYSMEAVDVGL